MLLSSFIPREHDVDKRPSNDEYQPLKQHCETTLQMTPLQFYRLDSPSNSIAISVPTTTIQCPWHLNAYIPHIWLHCSHSSKYNNLINVIKLFCLFCSEDTINSIDWVSWVPATATTEQTIFIRNPINFHRWCRRTSTRRRRRLLHEEEEEQMLHNLANKLGTTV